MSYALFLEKILKKIYPIKQIKQIIKRRRIHGIQENGKSNTKRSKGNYQGNKKRDGKRIIV